MQYFSRQKRRDRNMKEEEKSDTKPDNNQIARRESLKGFSGFSQNLTGSSQISEIFSFKIQDVVDASDLGLCWSYNVPVMKPNQKNIYFSTQSFQTILPNYVGDDFPQTLCFGLRDFNGYCAKDGTPTKTIIVMDLVATSIKTVNGITMRDLAYKCQSVILWNLGTLRNLRMELSVGQSGIPVPMPLSTPIQISFRIIHVVI